MNNPNCDGAGPCDAGQVRVLPTGGDGNAILCRKCFNSEMRYRRERNRDLSLESRFKLPKWEELKPYDSPANAPSITQVEMTDKEIEFAEKIAARLGFTQTAYTSTSQLWGLYCLPDSARHRHGCIIKTRELGFLFVADLEDMQLHDLAEQERKA